MSRPENVHSACLLGQSRGRSLLHPQVMGQVLSLLSQAATHHFADKGPKSLNHGFSSSHVWMWELDYKESWTPKNWCFWTVVLEKTLESPLDSKKIKPVNFKGNQPWILFGRADAEAETLILWPPDVKRQLIGKDPHAGKDWGQEEGLGREWDGWDGIIDSMDKSLSKLQETVKDREAWRAIVHGISKSWTWLSKWAITTKSYLLTLFFKKLGHLCFG